MQLPLSLDTPETDTPYLIIPPAKSHRWRLKIGRYGKGEYGGNVRWTHVTQCDTFLDLMKKLRVLMGRSSNGHNSLSELDDVHIDNIQEGQILQKDTATGIYTNATIIRNGREKK